MPVLALQRRDNAWRGAISVCFRNNNVRHDHAMANARGPAAHIFIVAGWWAGRVGGTEAARGCERRRGALSLRCGVYATRSNALARFFEPAGSNQINSARPIKKATPLGVAFLIWWAVLDSNQRPIG